MFKHFRFPLIFALLTILFSCDSGNNLLPDSTGKAGELVVVTDTVSWKAGLNNAVMNTFAQEQEGLPQREPLFNVYYIKKSAFTNIFKTARNIILIDIDKKNKPAYKSKADVWAKNQFVLQIFAPDEKAAARIINKNATTLTNLFRKQEIMRLKNSFADEPDKKLINKIKQKFNLTISIPVGYQLAIDTNQFIWARKMFNVGNNTVDQDLFICSQPYIKGTQFDNRYILSTMDSVSQRYVQGGPAGSYWQTYHELSPDTNIISIDKNYTKQLRGLWEMKNDFMGGPYVSNTFVDKKTNQLFTVVGFVYAPNLDKREYLREMSAIAASIGISEKGE